MDNVMDVLIQVNQTMTFQLDQEEVQDPGPWLPTV